MHWKKHWQMHWHMQIIMADEEFLLLKRGKELSISNPGTIRVTKEEFYAGGNSDPRNPNILKMFGFVNVGERAGSGVDKIMTAWAETKIGKNQNLISQSAVTG